MGKSWKILLALPLAFASCSDPAEADPKPAGGTINVSVGSGPKIDIVTQSVTRTELDKDGVSVKWAKDDRIACWAVDSHSKTTLDKQVFDLWHYNAEYNTAKFTGNIPSMPEDTYTYYAVSPVPAETDGMRAGYLIPAVQSGLFDGGCDIMVAEPVKGPALREGDNSETVQFAFRHLVHVLKIRIPKNDLGEKVSEIMLTFPEPVAGKMTVDVTDPYAQPVLTEASNTLTLRFNTPKDEGDTVYAIIAPVELSADQQVTILASGAVSESKPLEIAGKNFAAGHTTPIAYSVPAVGNYFTLLRFALPADKGTATLGEEVEAVTLTAPEGALFDNGSNVRSFTPEADGSYTIILRPSWTDNLSGQTLTVQYESESAIVSNTLILPQIALAEGNDMPALSVPYLLAEDFSGITANFDHNSSWSSKDNSNTAAIELGQYGLEGWTGARVGGNTGSSIRISFGYIGALVKNYKRPGRVDSCPLRGIKADKNPTLKVSYTYCTNYFIGVGKGGSVSVSAGYTDQTGGIDSNTTISNIEVPEAALDIDGNGDNGEYYDQADAHEKSFLIKAADPDTRLSWRVTSDRSGVGNGCYWFYLDNVKVSIVNE